MAPHSARLRQPCPHPRFPALPGFVRPGTAPPFETILDEALLTTRLRSASPNSLPLPRFVRSAWSASTARQSASSAPLTAHQPRDNHRALRPSSTPRPPRPSPSTRRPRPLLGVVSLAQRHPASARHPLMLQFLGLPARLPRLGVPAAQDTPPHRTRRRTTKGFSLQEFPYHRPIVDPSTSWRARTTHTHAHTHTTHTHTHTTHTHTHTHTHMRQIT